MLLDNSMRAALLISMIFHAIIFLPFPQFKRGLIKEPSPALKITYLVPKKAPPKETSLREEPVTKVTKQVKSEIPEVKIKPDSSYKAEDKPIKKTVSVAKPVGKDIKIEIPPELPKEKEALYLNYYQSIREKIRRLVLKNYPQFIACGEVCLYFVLLPEGRLKEIKVVEQRSSQNGLLKEIAKKSVQQAAPFASFPEDLSQPQLSFNVIISFELEN